MPLLGVGSSPDESISISLMIDDDGEALISVALRIDKAPQICHFFWGDFCENFEKTNMVFWGRSSKLFTLRDTADTVDRIATAATVHVCFRLFV